MLTSTGKQRQRKMTQREYDAASVRGNVLLKVESVLRHNQDERSCSSEFLWYRMPNEVHQKIAKETFYKWLLNWAKMGRLVWQGHYRGWFMWSTFTLPNKNETEAN